MSAACRSCGAPIVWAESRTTGRRVPLDAKPVATGAGLYTLSNDGTGAMPVGHDESSIPGSRLVYRNHFLTCPSASEHRKGKS